MMRATALTLAAISAACSSSSPESPPATVSAASKAGVVVELAGSVTATRDGKTRALAIGAAVSADDVVAVAADGRVTIELAHNNARWSLGAGRGGKVRESAAWELPKADQVAEAVAGDTSAAGRHAEKSAVDTAASTTITTPPKTPLTTPPPIPPPIPKVDPRPRPAKPAPEGDLGGLGLGGTGGGGGGVGVGGLGSLGHGAGGGTGAGYGGGAGRLGGDHHATTPTIKPGTATVSGSLPPAVIARIVRAHLGLLRACYETGLARDPSLHGSVTVKFVIGKDGTVSTAVATGFDAEVDRCISSQVGRFTFPEPEGGIVMVTYPITFDAP